MKTTCVCCGKRALHERVQSLGGTLYRCKVCNYVWCGVCSDGRRLDAGLTGPSLASLRRGADSIVPTLGHPASQPS